MATMTEISELRADMDAKFDKVFDLLAENASELNGFKEDFNGFREEVNGKLADLDAKLDKLLAIHGVSDEAGN